MSAEPEASDADFDQRPETTRGRAIYESLLFVHSHIRRDLETVRQLAIEAVDGAPARQMRERLHELKRDSILWLLQVNCLRYCSFVHLHHHAEDTHFFGELRQTNPSINPVIDRLQADHRRVADDLDAVEAAADGLQRDDDSNARQAVVETLLALERNLLAHLDYEELSIESTVLRLHDYETSNASSTR
jgi:Hemerythrin HHE cation binding domain